MRVDGEWAGLNIQACLRCDCDPLSSALLVQVLGVSEEPGRISDELHEVHHQSAFPPLPFHRGFRFAWHAAVWWKVSPSLYDK